MFINRICGKPKVDGQRVPKLALHRSEHAGPLHFVHINILYPSLIHDAHICVMTFVFAELNKKKKSRSVSRFHGAHG